MLCVPDACWHTIWFFKIVWQIIIKKNNSKQIAFSCVHFYFQRCNYAWKHNFLIREDLLFTINTDSAPLRKYLNIRYYRTRPSVLVHLSRRLKCTIVITSCPSSVCLSVRPSSVVNFSHFRLLLWNRWTEFKEIWQDPNVLYQVCVFRADRKNKMAALGSDWLRHFRLLLWNCWTEFNKTWQEAWSQRPLPSLCFSGQ